MKRHLLLITILAVLLLIWVEGAAAAFCPKVADIKADKPADRWFSEQDPGWRSPFKMGEYQSTTIVSFSSAIAYGGDEDFPLLAACIYKLDDGHVLAIEPNNKELPVDRTKVSSGYWAPVKDYGHNHIMYMCNDGRPACKFRMVKAVVAVP